MKKTFLFLITAVSLASCTDEKGATETILDAGLHPIEVGGYSWHCKKGDSYATKFKAYSPDSSRIVTGCVCGGGWGEGKTIRFD